MIKINSMKRANGLLYIMLTTWMIIFLSDCKKENSSSAITIQKLTGYAQKGPFINGSSVTIYDLQSDLAPTGKSYNVQIIDNKGTFELSNVSLSSKYVSLRADGFYFNEVLGAQSVAQISLYTLSDISGKTNININLLTDLEKPRIEYLMKNGESFSDSKAQSQREILAIFCIEKEDIKTFENLNISESGDDNAILLAISAILQGYRSESELTELLSNIRNDIKEDGVLDSDTLGSALINHAVYLDTIAIKSNLTKRYRDIGASSSAPDFGKYIANFISGTKFQITQPLIVYPVSGINGVNILCPSKNTFYSTYSNTYSFAANLPKGTSLKIKITSLSPADTNSIKPAWYYSMNSGINWSISDFDLNSYIQTFTAIESGKSCDLKMFFDKGSFLIEYFEMNSAYPKREKTITVI
jgi:hypothetical protein